MRYQPEHKAEIHRKIVKDASQRIRSEGITGAAVSTVMRDAGLTHGGFYKHFKSKDDLLLESLREAFTETIGRFAHIAAQSPRETAWKSIVKTYLSPVHCDHPELGCPLAALAPELARTGKAMKTRILAELENYEERLLPFMPGRRKMEKKRAFLAIFSTMIGAIAIARILPDAAARASVLATARDHLLRSF